MKSTAPHFPRLNRFSAATCLAAVVLLLPVCSFAQWKSTGPFGGSAEVVRSVPTSSGMVIAATKSALLYISNNGGAFWASVPFPGQFTGDLHALEVDPRSASVWYVGMQGSNSWGSGIYKTTDAGQTWNVLPQTKGIAVWSIALAPHNPDLIAAGTSEGVYLSSDAGAKWTHISRDGDPELRPVVSLAFDPSDSKTIYAGTTHLPWKTTDGGATWQSIHQGMIDDSDVFSIQVDQQNPSRIFASACSGVYGSVTSAGHWSKFSLPGGAYRTYFVALDPKRADTVFAGTTEGLMKSDDGGHVWRKTSGEPIKAIAFDPFVPGRIFFASTTAGLLVSNDGGNDLHESNYGFTNRNFTSLSAAGDRLYASSVYEPGSGGVYRSENLGLRWIHAGEPSLEQLLLMAATPDDPQHLFGAGYHKLLESTDSGRTWKISKSSPPGSRITAILPIYKTELLVGTDTGLYRSGTAGTWLSVASGRIESINRSGAKRFFALTSSGAMESADGAQWNKCGEPGPSTVWYGVAFDSGTSTALAATSSGLFRSTDSCHSWTAVRAGLREETTSLVIFHPTRIGEAFVSQGGRIFRSIDGGLQWTPLNEDNPGHSGPSSLVVLTSVPDRLFALFPRRGVFSTSIPPARQGERSDVRAHFQIERAMQKMAAADLPAQGTGLPQLETNYLSRN